MSGLSIRSPNIISPSPSSSNPKPFQISAGKENNPSSFNSKTSPRPKNDSNPPSKQENHLDLSNISLTNGPMELKPKVKNPLFLNKSLNEIPIPKGNTAYSRAKKAEYVERDLPKAEKYYKIAIRRYERLDSAIKDLATVLHQQGKTEEACKFLEEYRHLYGGDKVKYENLLINLRKQIVPSGNCLNRTLVLFDFPTNFQQQDIKALFGNSSRVLQVEFKQGKPLEDQDNPSPINNNNLLNFCLVHFASYSAARKTLETLREPNLYQFYWMNIYGKLAGKAELTKQASTQNDIPPPSTENQEIHHEHQEPEKTKDEPHHTPTTETQIPLQDSRNATTDPSSNSKSTNEDSHHGTEEKKISSSSSSIPPIPTPITKKPQPCWKNCVIITPCPLPQREPPDTNNTDVHQEILLSYVAYKVFENEDESWETFYWRQLLRKPSNNDMGNAKKRMKFSIWEKIEEKEKEVHSRVMNDSQYLENLLSSITFVPVPEKQDPVPEESNNKEVLEFFPGINMRFQTPFAAVKRPQPQENYQGYNLFPKKSALQQQSMEYVPSWTNERSQDSSRNGINGMRNYPFQRISSSSHYENEPLNPYYVFNNRHF